jgi:hypothetical protein
MDNRIDGVVLSVVNELGDFSAKPDAGSGTKGIVPARQKEARNKATGKSRR